MFFSSKSAIDVFQFSEKMQWGKHFIQTMKYLYQEIQFFRYIVILMFRLGHVNEFKSILQALFMCPGYCLVSWDTTEGMQTTTTVGCAGGTPPDTGHTPRHPLEQGEKKNIRHWGTGANLVLMEMGLLQIWVAAVRDRSTPRVFCTAYMILAQLYIRRGLSWIIQVLLWSFDHTISEDYKGFNSSCCLRNKAIADTSVYRDLIEILNIKITEQHHGIGTVIF